MMNSTAERTLVELDAHVVEDARGDAIALADEAQEQMLSADVVVVEPLRFFLSKRQDLASAVRELVEAIHRIPNACSLVHEALSGLKSC